MSRQDKMYVRLSTFGGQTSMHYSKETCEEQVDLYSHWLRGTGKEPTTKLGGGKPCDTWCIVCCNLDKAAVMGRAADVL